MAYKCPVWLRVAALTVLLLILWAGSAEAELSLVPDNWRPEDTRRQIAYTTIAIIDAGQTADIQRNDGIHEAVPAANAILGDQPSPGETAAYFAGAAVLNYAVSAMLPPKARTWWQWSTITVNGAIVANNYQLGLRWGF